MRRPSGQGHRGGCPGGDRRDSVGEHGGADHGRKRWAYQTIPSLRHYVLVDQDEGGVEVTSPNEDGTWQSVILRDLDDRLQLTALKVAIGLEEVFTRVAFHRAPAGAGAPNAS